MNSIELCENQNDFIMLPKVDFCFKEIMQNEPDSVLLVENVYRSDRIRKGI